jgi:adenosylhomocysteine nucleosidase
MNHMLDAAPGAITFSDPCILFALRREAGPFLREFRPQQRFPGAPCFARFCGPSWLTVLVAETGIGTARIATALDWLLGGPLLENVPYRPQLVLSAGFSGALDKRFQVGDIILATEIADRDGKRWPTTWPGDLTGEWRPPLHRGRLLTMPHLVGTPEEKRSLGQKHEAVAVDMETAAVARLCSQRDVPFGCVRAISDRVDTALSPRLVKLLAGGRASPLCVVAALMRSPGLAKELWRLARDTRMAARQLGIALGELLTLTLPA